MSTHQIDYTEESFQIFNQAQEFVLPYYGLHQQVKQEGQIYSLLVKLWKKMHINRVPQSQALASFFKALDRRQALFAKSFLSTYIDAGLLEKANEFIELGQAHEDQLDDQDLFQAFRNICVIFSLQLDKGQAIQLTPAIYGYGMLYPYTDNFLDDPTRSPKEKQAFNQRIHHALSHSIQPSHRIESLIELIASEYPRHRFPHLFQALDLVLQAQEDSLSQADSVDLASASRISLKKGGAAVLADAYLVSGHVNQEESLYAFLYGGLLQFVDDFQDVEEDLSEGVDTYFSLKQDDFDGAVKKLLAMVQVVAPAESKDLLATTIRFICLFLIFEAVNGYKDMLSPPFYNRLSAASPVRLSFYKRLRHLIYSQTDKHS